MAKRLISLGILAAFMAALLFTAPSCSKDSPAGKVITYPLAAEPAQLDPQVTTDPSARLILLNVMEGLTRIGGDGRVVPGVAARWDVSDDGLTYTFYLRPDSFWVAEDGAQVAPVTAADFVFGIRRALEPATRSPYAGEMMKLKNADAVHTGEMPLNTLGVEAQGDFTLVITLEAPEPEIPRMVAGGAWLPCHEDFFYETTGQYGFESESLIYNGPFRIMYWEHNRAIRLKANNKYRGDTVPSPSGVSLTITQENIPQLLADKQIDAAPMTGEQFAALTLEGATEVSFFDTTWALCFGEKDELFKQEAVRRAFAAALDTSQVDAALSSAYMPATGLIPPAALLGDQTYRDAYPVQLPRFAPDEAGELWNGAVEAAAEAGGEKKVPSVTLLCPDTAALKLPIGFMVQSWQKNLQVYAEVQTLPLDKLRERVAAGDYQMAVYPICEGEQADATLRLFTGGALFPTDAQYDRMLLNALHGAESRGEALRRCEQELLDRARVYPLFFERRYFVMAKGISGLHFRPFDCGVDFLRAGKLE